MLGGLRAKLRAPKVIAEYARTYLEERKRLAASSNAKRQRLEQQLGQLNREIDRLVDAIAKATAIRLCLVHGPVPWMPSENASLKNFKRNLSLRIRSHSIRQFSNGMSNNCSVSKAHWGKA